MQAHAAGPNNSLKAATMAGHQRPADCTRYIFTNRALAHCHCRPLGSNVKRRKNTLLDLRDDEYTAKHRRFHAEFIVKSIGSIDARLMDVFATARPEDYVGRGPWPGF